MGILNNTSIPSVKRRDLRAFGSEVFLLLLSALLFSFAFPGFLTNEGFGFLGFIALIPLFAVIRNTVWKTTPLYGFLFGFTFYSLFNYWLASFHPLAVYIAPIIMGTEMILLFPVLKLADKLFPKYGFVLQTIIWVGYEYLKTLGFVGYPYGIVGYSQYEFIPFIQISSIFGIWGVSLLTVFPSIFLGRLFADWRQQETFTLKSILRKFQIPLAGYAFLMIASLVYGGIIMQKDAGTAPEKMWRVATIQHNADSWKGGFSTYTRNYLNLKRMSLQSLEENPDIIIWSETAFVPAIYWHTNYQTDEQMFGLVSEFTSFAKTLPVPLLTGNDDGRLKDESLPPVLEDGTYNRIDYNAVILYGDGALQQTYRKQHLVPFTEHFPYEKQLPWFYNFLRSHDYHFWEKGYDPVVFEVKNSKEETIKFSTPICFEDVFGYLSADFTRSGAEVIVNMTNDSWSGAVSAEMQHLAMSIFRAVENKRTLVRGTNSGMTAIVDPTGNILDMMDPFVMGFRVNDVPVYTDATTIYTLYDDWFAWFCIYVSIAFLVYGLIVLVLKRFRQ